MRKKIKKTLFDFIDLGEEIEKIYLSKLKIAKDSKSAVRDRLAFLESKRIEKLGVCQGCGSNVFLRWVDNGVYLCYDCFYEDLKLAGEFYSYHGRHAEDMDEYVDDAEWEELWRQENPHIIYDEENDEYHEKTKEEALESICSLFDVFAKRIKIDNT